MSADLPNMDRIRTLRPSFAPALSTSVKNWDTPEERWAFYFLRGFCGTVARRRTSMASSASA